MEYSDQLQAVNVMNDPSLVAYVDIEAMKKATGELASQLDDLSKKKVALLRLSVDGEQSLENVSCRVILQKVMGVMAPKYRACLRRSPSDASAADEELDLDFLRGRLKVLGGDLSKSVSQVLGLTSAQ